MEVLINQDYAVKVYFAAKDEEVSALDKEYQDYAKETGFSGEANTVFKALGPNSPNVVVVGLGEEISHSSLVSASVKASRELDASRVKEASFVVPEVEGLGCDQTTNAVAEGVLQSAYKFDHYSTDKKDKYLTKVSVETTCQKAEEVIQEAKNLVDGINITRDLVNTRSNDMVPEDFTNKVEEIFSDIDSVEVEILGKDEIEALEMNTFLAVNRASDHDPRFMILRYLPEGKDVAAETLVGKGITYDSGGYAIKPANSMDTMFTDMTGAASVVGTIYALAKNGVKRNVVGVAPLTENMVDGEALKNGDIITSMKGTTIEVGNTDAEGRLVLADALYYAATKVNSARIIDIATLTGAAVYTFGDQITATITNDDEFLSEVNEAADYAGELQWQLPTPDYLREKVKGTFGDLKNSPSGGGGTITAGIFLEHFVEGKPWVHLDIAGPSYSEKAWGMYPNGATGIPVKTLYNYISSTTK